jgi:hypothetical protein
MRGQAADGRRDLWGGWLMDGWTGPALPAALSRAQQKIELWRQQHRPRARLPEELWREAAKLACIHGINPTARALRLDYYALKEHAAAAAEAGEPAPDGHSPQFVEVLPAAIPGARPECLIEIEEAGGDKMRIRLAGGNLPDVAQLTRAFRERRG